MRYLRRIIYILLLAAMADYIPLWMLVLRPLIQATFSMLPWLPLLAVFLFINLFPLQGTAPTRQIRQLAAGCELLRLFMAAFALSMCVQLLWICLWVLPAIIEGRGGWWRLVLLDGAVVFFSLGILFWSGMIRVYLTSVQLGVKHRVLAAICGWIPFVNLWYLARIIRITGDEVRFETEKWEIDLVRAESGICRTRYPLLLVHGVFFRDFRYLDYWGRVPKELIRNGASVYYGQQQSAASVEEGGRELALRIRQIVEETGCKKVNIIAHSKGGLDSRAAISHWGMAPYVASLTTVNTPHRGCIFAEYLLGRVPEMVQHRVAAAYNAALRMLGDTAPDFLAAVTDLTESACAARNAVTPDAQGVLYESVMSYCKKAQNGRFPLNMTYPVVRHFDGLNDGLVSVKSARWGEKYTLLEPKGERGISHADMIDLNRENIHGFDVREFYVGLVADLKRRGY